ncbi:MAG: tRNA (adenosine(37)-N6)-threonylcarbamoyltransferase complex ATPase subunit type 1 TsaE [Psychrilyobacter sp.]|uniref:tRNA (adenosine(37)-N6)-threonylcarbamoyltransferase complex ATPase subunit type 1 TsaE n=1 Tax=Psychrilyobacter sp. TaxID=2586924 RepID=UPI003C71B5BC
MKRILSFEELTELAVKLAKFVVPNDVIALVGDLGTGKTTLTKTIAKELGITGNIKSPTFNYVLEHLGGKMPLYHFDVYRLCDPEEVYEIGYEDYLHNGGLTIIEWANIIETELPKEYIEIKMYHRDENSREVEMKFVGNEKREKELKKLW